MRRRPLYLVFALFVIAFSVGVARLHAAPSGYGVAATKSCLLKEGATFGSGFAAGVATLPASEREKVLAGVVGVGSPVFLYLAFGTNVGEATTIRARIEKQLPFTPSATNSRAGTVGNVAWLLESSVGTRPAAALQQLVLGCLRGGAVPQGSPSLTRASLTECLNARGNAELMTDKERGLLGFPPVPTSVSRSMLTWLVTTTSAQGVWALVLFGHDQASSVALRNQLQKAIGPLAGEAVGQTRGIAWLTARTRKATSKEASDSQRLFLSCLN